MGIEQFWMRETWVEAENVIFPFISHLESRRVISLLRMSLTLNLLTLLKTIALP